MRDGNKYLELDLDIRLLIEELRLGLVHVEDATWTTAANSTHTLKHKVEETGRQEHGQESIRNGSHIGSRFKGYGYSLILGDTHLRLNGLHFAFKLIQGSNLEFILMTHTREITLGTEER